PGSGLKGLAAHYCARVWGPTEEKELFQKGKDYHKLLFGATDDGGVILFHDAWILPQSVGEGCLLLDVMTPHHPDWPIHRKAPTDWDSPNPIAFLSAAGAFRIAISWLGPPGHPQAERWTDLAFTLLKEALREWGVGGKTSSGYGRLVPAEVRTGVAAARP